MAATASMPAKSKRSANPMLRPASPSAFGSLVLVIVGISAGLRLESRVQGKGVGLGVCRAAGS